MTHHPHDPRDDRRPAGSPDGPAPWSGEPVPAPRYGQYVHGQESADPRGAQRGGHDGAAQRRRRPRRVGAMPVTWTLIGICAVMWGLQWLTSLFTPYSLTSILGYAPALTDTQPWRMLTSGFVHAMPSPLHLLLNMYTLYLFGRMLEPLLGTWRMAVLFVVSVLGGSVGVLLLGNPWVLVIGASGGVFGLFGAMFVFMRHFKNNITPIAVLIAINLAFGFLVGGIAWQAHVGGLIAGAVVALAMLPGLRRRF